MGTIEISSTHNISCVGNLQLSVGTMQLPAPAVLTHDVDAPLRQRFEAPALRSTCTPVLKS